MNPALAGRLELLGTMTADDMRTALAHLAGYNPAAFDEAAEVVVPAAGVKAITGDDQEPYCTECGESVGVFAARGNAYLHYRIDGAVTVLTDVGHGPVVGWRPVSIPAGAR
jgi:hypothetical protein